ncbi:hypothetical protein [Rahnella aquatilis]|uniref:hypothetical protein n=1 Tax=Rahnella aquatilis TaxID=34038 RepID=UPI000AE3AB37|nr:hypothetical protein [Rahnella aquatilis]
MPPYLAFQLWYEASDIPASRQTFLTVRPASTDFRTVMIWCSVKRDTYILTASVNGFIVANASDNNVDWAKSGFISFPVPAKASYTIYSSPNATEGCSSGIFNFVGYQ